MDNNLKTIHLYGKLAEMCETDKVELCGNDIRVLMSGLDMRYKVKNYIIQNSFEVKYDDNFINEDGLGLALDDVKDIHLYPVVEGSGSRTGQIILGIALIGIGIWTGGMGFAYASQVGTALVSTGAGLVLSGIFQQTYSANDRERPDERASFVFNGAVNSVQEGSAAPLVYGRFLTGSVVLSAGLDIGQMQNPSVGYGPPGGAPPPGSGIGPDPYQTIIN